ncbi:MAG: hypothetical protein ACFB2W_06740 [Leptolyngbyaceae cyanobacterium]
MGVDGWARHNQDVFLYPSTPGVIMWLKIPIDLDTEAANAHLLQELDRWMALGLLSDGQAVSIGRQLCSRLPVPYKAPNPGQGMAAVDDTAANTAVTSAHAPSTPIFSRFKSRLVQSFLAEMSVLWLLFLGVFLVVLSSAVLAASQWQSFAVVGQYAILLVYTLAFGGASRWVASQAKLQTTAQMLKAATLLLIPVNLWMIDALGVIKASAGLAILAGLGLSGLTLILAPQRRAGLNLLGLSWLHWGWGFAVWPLLATYLGTVGSAMNLLLPGAAGGESDGSEPREQGGGLLVAIALLILLIRSLWIAQVPFYQLGLACGTCGWMLCRLQRSHLPQVGAGLMGLGWLVAVEQQPLQAIGVSGLAVWLLVDRLRSQERRQLTALATLWLIGLQACGLLWLLLPLDFRQGLLTAIGQFSPQPVSALNVAGVWLYGYVALMLAISRQFRRRGLDVWGRLTEQLSLGIAAVLVLCAVPQSESFLLTLSLAGMSATLAAMTRLRRSATWFIYGTHGSLLVTVLSGLYAISLQLGGWTETRWAMVLIGLTLMEWVASVATHRYHEWRCSGWYLGIGLSVLAYSLLLNNWGSWLNAGWLAVPTVLTWMVHRRQFATDNPKMAASLTVLALAAQGLLLNSWQMATVALGCGALLLWLHSCRWPAQNYLPALTVGCGVGAGHTAAIWLWFMDRSEHEAQFGLLVAIVAVALSLLARRLNQSPRPLLNAYGAASYGWSRTLAILLSLGLTLVLLLVYGLAPNPSGGYVRPISLDVARLLHYGSAAMTLVLARFVGRRTNLDYWEAAYELGLLVAMGIFLGYREFNPQTLGMALVTLGLGAQLLGTVAARQRSYLSSWHYIPLAYGALGLGLGHLSFTATTGLYSLAVGLTALAVARRKLALRSLGYGGLGLLSLGIYELVIHRMLQTSGGQPGDGLTLLALVGGAIAPLYLLCSPWMQRFTGLTRSAIQTVSLLHWMLAVTLAALAMMAGQSPTGLWLWLGVATLLSIYAWLRGNCHWFPVYESAAEGGQPVPNDHHSYKQWTWSGLIIATIAIPYGVDQLFPNLILIRRWGALLACGLSFIVHAQPWQRLGWPQRPWRRMALGWPILSILLNATTIKTQSLLLVGAFYAVMAQRLRAVRLSYVSLGLLNWSLLRYLLDNGWLTPLWSGTLLGLSALYILEVDPRWQSLSARQERHYLRCLATLLIGLTAIFQAEIASSIFIGVSLLISLGLIGLGLFQQVRAYLYVGTLTFVLQTVRTVMMFVDTDGRMLWAVGIVLGIALIWMAATFESRRAQIRGLLSQWSEMLTNWD